MTIISVICISYIHDVPVVYLPVFLVDIVIMKWASSSILLIVLKWTTFMTTSIKFISKILL